MLKVTNQQYNMFRRAGLTSKMYENKNTVEVLFDHYGEGIHGINIGEGVDGDIDEEIVNFFVDCPS